MKDVNNLMGIYGEYVSKILEMKDNDKISLETFLEEVKFGKEWITYCKNNSNNYSKDKCSKFLLGDYLDFLNEFHKEYK